MPKPNGISLGLSSEDGRSALPTIRVTPHDRTTDTIWDAVQDARDAGWTFQNFKKEVVAAWRDEIEIDAKRELKNVVW